MNWLALLNVRNVLLLCVLALSAAVWWQRGQLQNMRDAAALAEHQLADAARTSEATKATIKALEVERDAFVLKRAMEQREAAELVAQSQQEAQEALAYAMAAKERIRKLSRQADCRTAMAMPICPAIADELRAAP